MTKGVVEQLRRDELLKDGCFGVQVPDDDAEVRRGMMGPAQGFSGKYSDDVTKQVLKDALVEEARAKELAYFDSKGVWLKVRITVGWVDVNKGGEQNPNYRSRRVARQRQER